MAANPHLFNIVSEGELSEVLSHYDTEYVLNIVQNAFQNRYNANSVIPMPNVVAAWEQNFKQLMAYYNYNEFTSRIQDVRNETYKEIISAICNEFNLNFTIDDEIDLYSAAFYLYDFFVSNFNSYLISFFSNYIYKERAEIYETMGLAEQRKNKDTSTTYGKRLYKDIKLAVINANIYTVVTNLFGMDISLDSILLTVLPREHAQYIGSLVSSKGEFYRTFYGSVMNSPIRSVLLTEIRFGLQNLAKAHGDPLQYNENNNEGE